MPFFLPKAALDQHIAILGKTGSGKTFTAKLIVEHVLEQRRQVCVIDPTGAWSGLRLAADGKGRGFDVVLLGGKHADLPLAERSGSAIARLVTDQGASVVIDTSDFGVGERTRWFTDFATTLYRSVREPLHLVIDEAHNFMPQGKVPDPAAGQMLHAGNQLMSGGRSRGIRATLITQRPQKLHKDSLTCADTLIAMRLIAPHDRAAVKDWIDGMGDPVKGKAVLDSLAQLQRGEGWVWYPEGDHLARVQFPDISTYDSSATPKHGAKSSPKIAEIDLTEVKKSLAEAVKEAEANDPKLLRAEIAKLRKELAAKPTAADPAKLESEYRRGQTDERKRWMSGLNGTPKDLVHVGQLIGRATESLRMLCDVKDIPANAVITKTTHATTRPERNRIIPVTAYRSQTLPGDETLGRGGMRRILTVLAQRPGLTNSQIGVRAGLSSKSGTFSTYLGKLRANGWIRDEGDRRYPTDDGISALGSYDPLPTGQELLSHWVGELGSSGASRMLRVIADAYPNGLTNEQIGEAANVSHLSGTFSTYMGKLRSLELIEGRGTVTASKELFE